MKTYLGGTLAAAYLEEALTVMTWSDLQRRLATELYGEVKFDKEQIEGSIVLGKITNANEKQLFATAI